jgi:WAS/WASL-interacting protein
MSSELLKQIQSGKKLKKTETNDRSAPLIETSSKPLNAGQTAPSATSSAAVPSQGGPQLAGLFAGGMPKLKPTVQGNLGEYTLCKSPPDFYLFHP